jgi:hypothetical protein
MSSPEDHVYVVSGRPIHEHGRVVACAMTPDESRQAVVRAPGRVIRFFYRAASDIDVRFRNERRSVAPGAGVLEFPWSDRGLPNESVMLQVVPFSAYKPAELHITRVECS